MDLFSANVAYASVDSFIGKVDRLIVNPLIGLIFAVAVAYFLYGMLQFFLNGDNDEKRTEGKSHMIYGVIGITVMMGVWGILGILLRTFNITGVDPQKGEVHLSPYNPTYPPRTTP
ncbi:MAG: pilin [bacterium]|nr:pilin [bacterium]